MTFVILSVTTITVPYSEETLKNLVKHLVALNQHENLVIQNDLRTKRIALASFSSYDGAN